MNNKYKILVVEDENNIRNIITALLEANGIAPVQSSKNDGEFVVTKGEKGKATADLSQKDFFMYNLLCFLNLVRFWDEFNEIRDMNTIKVPIFIKLPDNTFKFSIMVFNKKIR